MKFSTLAFIIKHLTLFKNNKGIVHIISLISLIGVAIGSFALIVVISVFNGFTDVAKTMLEKTCPPLLIESTKGDKINANIIKNIDIKNEKLTVIPIIKQTALVSVGDNRSVATIMGIDSTYFLYNSLDTCIVLGKDIFNVKDSLFCLTGVNQASMLGLNKGAEKMNIPIKITVPATDKKEAIIIEDKLSSIEVIYQASYQTHSDMDGGLVFIPINKARQLLNMEPNTCNNLYVIENNNKKIDNLQKALQTKLGNDYQIKNILEQEPIYFRIVKSEKIAVYIILSFIIFIATINIISTIIILHIQKEKMNKIFRTIGIRLNDLRKIYFAYGFIINIIGCLLGITIGILLCLLQQQYGLIKLATDSFVVDAFPIKILLKDIISVAIIVIFIGGITIGIISSRIKS